MKEVNKIRVINVDDHQLIRSGLNFLLDSVEDIEFVGEAKNGTIALHLCRQLKPDVIVLDLMMPDMDGIAVTEKIKEECPDVQVLALTAYFDKDSVRNMLQAGAIGYLIKGTSTNELVEAIRSAHAGIPTLSPEATMALIRANPLSDKMADDLTKRQQEVLTLITEGLSNPQIARQLFVSPSTVRHHVSEILSKLGAANRAEAAVLALRYSLVK